MDQKYVAWTRPMLARFKRDYASAVKRNVDVFTFDGNEYLVAYAKYLIEYLANVFPERVN